MSVFPHFFSHNNNNADPLQRNHHEIRGLASFSPCCSTACGSFYPGIFLRDTGSCIECRNAIETHKQSEHDGSLRLCRDNILILPYHWNQSAFIVCGSGTESRWNLLSVIPLALLGLLILFGLQRQPDSGAGQLWFSIHSVLCSCHHSIRNHLQVDLWILACQCRLSSWRCRTTLDHFHSFNCKSMHGCH